MLSDGLIEVDFAQRQVTAAGAELELSPTEFKLDVASYAIRTRS